MYFIKSVQNKEDYFSRPFLKIDENNYQIVRDISFINNVNIDEEIKISLIKAEVNNDTIVSTEIIGIFKIKVTKNDVVKLFDTICYIRPCTNLSKIIGTSLGSYYISDYIKNNEKIYKITFDLVYNEDKKMLYITTPNLVII